jgi:hypothetical protein
MTNITLKLLAALKDLLGDQPSVQNFQCFRCGRDYRDIDDLAIETGDCPSDDCPSYHARAVIAEAEAMAVTAQPAETQATHTPGPWDCDGCAIMYAAPHETDEITMIQVRANVTEAGWDTVAFVEAIWPNATANARRIVAAVNACEGIGTKALERTRLREMLTALRGAEHYLADDLDEDDEMEMRVFNMIRAAKAAAEDHPE